MQAYAEYLPDKMKMVKMCGGVWLQCAGVCIFCCRTAAISALFTPLSTFRFQPLPAVAFLANDVDITFHYVISQFSALAGSALLGIPWRFSQALAFLAGLGVSRRYRWS